MATNSLRQDEDLFGVRLKSLPTSKVYIEEHPDDRPMSHSPLSATRHYTEQTHVTKHGHRVPDKTRESLWSRSSYNSWLEEIFSLSCGMICLLLLITMLLYFDRKSRQLWPIGVTPNATISLIVTIMNACLALPLASGFGQLKWIQLKRKRQTLYKIQRLEIASRGVSGSIGLLMSTQGGVIGSTGAVVAILMLAVGPFAQQVLRSPLRQALAGEAVIGRASEYTELSRQSGSLRYATLPMRAAIYNPILGFASSSTLSDPAYACPTGNCTWNPFQTLGIRSDCTNITKALNWTLDSEDQLVTWSLPSDYNNVSIQGWLNNTELDHSYSAMNVTSIPGSDPSNNRPDASILHFALLNSSLFNTTEATALSCRLEYCILSVESTTLNGALRENVTEVPSTWLPSDESSSYMTLATLSDPSKAFNISSMAASALTNTLGLLFNGTAYVTGNAVDTGMSYSNDIMMAFWKNQDIAAMMHVLARSMSTHLRSVVRLDKATGQSFTTSWQSGPNPLNASTPDAVVGKSFVAEKVFDVRWPWLILPIATVLVTALFLVVVMIETRRSGTKLWKNSMLALLFHGLSEDVRRRVLVDNESIDGRQRFEVESLSGMHRAAKKIKVRLRNGEGTDVEELS